MLYQTLKRHDDKKSWSQGQLSDIMLQAVRACHANIRTATRHCPFSARARRVSGIDITHTMAGAGIMPFYQDFRPLVDGCMLPK